MALDGADAESAADDEALIEEASVALLTSSGVTARDDATLRVVLSKDELAILRPLSPLDDNLLCCPPSSEDGEGVDESNTCGAVIRAVLFIYFSQVVEIKNRCLKSVYGVNQ